MKHPGLSFEEVFSSHGVSAVAGVALLQMIVVQNVLSLDYSRVTSLMEIPSAQELHILQVGHPFDQLS
jgi:hypothetical protein